MVLPPLAGDFGLEILSKLRKEQGLPAVGRGLLGERNTKPKPKTEVTNERQNSFPRQQKVRSFPRLSPELQESLLLRKRTRGMHVKVRTLGRSTALVATPIMISSAGCQ
jgi:hypothetical protein